MSTRTLQIGCEFVHQSRFDVPSVFQVEPLGDQDAELVEATWSFDPDLVSSTYTDLYGNLCRRLTIPAGRSTITYDAAVIVTDDTEEADEDAPEIAPEKLPDDVLIYTLPSRYALPDVLGKEAWNRFGGLTPGYTRVQAICDYVNSHLTFQYGASNSRTTAADVHASGYGVCRDFTHLGVSLCRALNIPARYVFGYLPQIEVPPLDAPMDFAAWMEVYLGDRWWTFDPRNNQRRKGRVLIGRGRDAGDVAMATTFGSPYLESMVVTAQDAPGNP
ncbi:transglutaminase family protein [Microlunatus capsulatus]|uniref:Transglutaminase-like putative cysteine protease n=1 Tax=Microlunatus capsulatus TaxID=99117 RepID=A0ABS4ZBZ0_9ACTN|nr:transglutaminase family protein [Microlunatus capsulatus]MBP2418260.1 transglutaminase-like putative cysteine protease [Microlunatus capsulatus]